MTLTVTGAQGVTTSSLALSGTTPGGGEITLFTTAATANATAIVTWTLTGCLSCGTTGDANFVVGAPGAINTGLDGYAPTNDDSAVSSGTGLYFKVASAGDVVFGAIGGTIKAGPSTAIKIPYTMVEAAGASTFYYTINYHVAYIVNP